MVQLASVRKAYGQALVALGEARPEVVALGADISNSDFSYMFQERFPRAVLQCRHCRTVPGRCGGWLWPERARSHLPTHSPSC